MLKLNVIRGIRTICNGRYNISQARNFHHEFTQKEPQKIAKDDGSENADAAEKHGVVEAAPAQQNTLPGAIRNKYQIFNDEDASQIFDVEEERERYQTEEEPQVMLNDEFQALNLKRGIHGVFDIEDLVDVLRKESAEDVFVCSVPRELKYVDYMVVCCGRSYRHMLSIAEFVRRVYKVKRSKNDIIPKIEGEKSRQWMALDLGNIALHLFSPSAREEYDLESLWAIGIEYDKETNKPEDPLVELFEKHSILLNDMKPQTKIAEP